MDNKAEQTEYLNTLDSMFQSLVPPVSSIVKIENCFPPTLDTMLQVCSLAIADSNYQLILQTVKAMRKAPHKDLENMRKELERTLSMAIKAGEMAIKMLDDARHNAKVASRMHLASLVGYVSYAKAYHDEFIKKRDILCKRLAAS